MELLMDILNEDLNGVVAEALETRGWIGVNEALNTIHFYERLGLPPVHCDNQYFINTPEIHDYITKKSSNY